MYGEEYSSTSDVFANFTVSPNFDSENKFNSSTINYNGISVKQILTIVNNNSTNREDVVEIRYEVTNNTTVDHSVGTRIMLDTMLAGNDHAPFKIPINGAVQDVTTQMEFVGDDIPAFWQAMDSLVDPSTISQGTFSRATTNKPDVVQFTNWWQVYEDLWDTPIYPESSNGDSAVTVTWNEETIPAGQTRSYVTYYGLSQLNSDLRPPLAVSVYNDSFINVLNRQYSPNPIDITVYIQNIGNADATNAYAEIQPGEGLSVVNSDARRDLGTVSVGGQEQIAWQLQLAPVDNDTERTFTIEVGADGQETKTLTQTILVPSIYRDDSGDTDGDGLLDSWETYGADFNGDGEVDLALNKMGANPNVKDVFVEVDWMDGVLPTTQQYFDKVAAEFAAHNIQLHIDAGPDSIDYVTGKKWSSYPGGSGGNEIPYVDEFDSFDRMKAVANAEPAAGPAVTISSFSTRNERQLLSVS